MSVLQNVYAIARERPSLDSLREVARRLDAERLVTAPFFAGRVVQNEHVPERLSSPEFPPASHRACPSLDDALATLVGPSNGVVTMTALATSMRARPQDFYDHPAHLGAYWMPAGQALVIGEPEDFSDLVDDIPELRDLPPKPPAFEGTAFACLWLHGKNAPLLADFVGSPLHRVILSVWPDALFVEETWL